jgi:hypothetical protein
MSIKQEIKNRFEDYKRRCLQEGIAPAVIIASGIDPNNKSTYNIPAVLHSLPSLQSARKALESAIAIVDEQIKEQSIGQ